MEETMRAIDELIRNIMAFEWLEEERIGKRTHEQFHPFLRQMLALYLR